MVKEYYKILELTNESISKTDIRKAYINIAKKTHPDKGGNEEDFKKVNKAYEILIDENKRREYDRGESVSVEEYGCDYGEEIPKDGSAVVKYTNNIDAMNKAWLELAAYYADTDGFRTKKGMIVSDYHLVRAKNLLKILNFSFKDQYLESKNEIERVKVVKGFNFWDNGSGLSNEVNWNNNFKRIKRMLDYARKEVLGLEEVAYENLKPMIEGITDAEEYNHLYYHGKHEIIREFSTLWDKIYGGGYYKYKAFDSTRVDETWKELVKIDEMGNFRSIWVKDDKSKVEEIKRFNQVKLEKMKEVVDLMKRLVDDEKSNKLEVEDKPVKDKKQAEVEGKVRQEFSKKNGEVGNEIQRLIHEAQGLSIFEELEVKINEIEKYREEKVYKVYQDEVWILKAKLSGINESDYKKGVVKRIEDKLKEVGKKENDLTDKERNDLVKIKSGGVANLNDIGEIENGIVARISKSNFSDVLNNLLKEANELVENVAKGTADKLQKLRKGLYNFQFSSNIHCREVFEEKKVEVASALNQLETVSYSEFLPQEESSLFRPEVIIPVALISLLAIGTVLMIKKARRR